MNYWGARFSTSFNNRMSLLGRVEQVEVSLKALESQYSEVSEVSDKLGTGQSLLNLEQLVAGYRSKAVDLLSMAEEGRTKTDELSYKVQTMVSNADQTLKEIICKRQKEAKQLEERAVSVESVFMQLKTEGAAAEKHLKAVLKEETSEVTGNFQRRLSEERSTLLSALDLLKASQTRSVALARKQSRRTLQSLSDYTRDNFDTLSILKTTSLMSQNRLNSEDAKALILTEVTGRLTKGISALKDHMESKSASMSSKYLDDLVRLRTEVESAKVMILGQREEVTPPADPSPVTKLTNFNGDIRRLLNHIGAFCAKGIRGVRESTGAVKRSLAVIDQEGISEQGQNLLRETKKQLEACSENLATISTKIRSDFYGVQEALNEGKSLIFLKNFKLPTDQKPSFDVQKDLRGRLEKEVCAIQYNLTRERVEKLLTETQEEIRSLRTGQEHWSQQLTEKESEFDSPSGSGSAEGLRSEEDDDDDFDDI